MKQNTIPSTTIDLIRLLEEWYPDVLELDPTVVGTPDYWKKAGVVELIQRLKIKSSITTAKEI